MSTSVIPYKITTGYKIETHVYIYLIKKGTQNILVDTSTHYDDHASQIFSFLKKQGISHLDYLLLTHAHNDHAGNAREIKDRYPEVKIIAHELSAARIEKGSGWFREHGNDQKKVFTAYGRPDIDEDHFFKYMGDDQPSMLPQSADIIVKENIEIDGIRCCYTPGHSMDHLCYGIDQHFFGGDMVLSYIPGMEGVWTGEFDSFEYFIKSAQKLRFESDRYQYLHHFHGKPLDKTLEEWYLTLIVPKALKKLNILLGFFREKSGLKFSLLELMQVMHPNFPDHYVYISQYISMLVFMEKHEILNKEDREGTWFFSLKNDNPKFFQDYLS